MKEKVELKPCPFCGSEATEYDGYRDKTYVECNNRECGVVLGPISPIDAEYSRIENAGESWNKRI